MKKLKAVSNYLGTQSTFKENDAFFWRYKIESAGTARAEPRKGLTRWVSI